MKEKDTFTFEIIKRSIDARKKPDIFYSYTVDVDGLKERDVIRRVKEGQVSLVNPVKYRFPSPGNKSMGHRPVIVGTGPAGLFCGYMLAIHGYRPVLLERGMEVEKRCKKVEEFWKTGKLDEECNVQFGEGGAGTFSDGKLNTLVKDKDGRNKEALSIFVSAGAPQHILYDGKPHIGTDILRDVVKNIREEILALGGDVHFRSRMTDIQIEKGGVSAVEINHGIWIPCDVLVLAIGHSARDTFEMLNRKAVAMEAKSFAVGVRIEHPQNMIDFSQYGRERGNVLPAADYKLTRRLENGRGCYSFCMCPGGYVVNASSEQGMLAVNGMSYHDRGGANANSAMVVTVNPADYGGKDVLAGMHFQRKLEEAAYRAGDGKVPVQLLGDFCQGIASRAAGEVEPGIKGEFVYADLKSCFPQELYESLKEGILGCGQIIRGFDRKDAVLSGVESRTSSPVKIPRNEELQGSVAGIYPCGEGAGYAGGITSAAMDGIKVAEAVMRRYAPSVV